MVRKIINIIKGHYYNLTNKKEKLYNDRMQICNDCENIVKTTIGKVCSECGCPLSAKTRVIDEKCDLDKW